MDYRNIKSNAKNKINMNLSMNLLVSVLFCVISGALTSTVIGGLIVGVISFGFTYVCTKINKGESFEYLDLFCYFKNGEIIIKVVLINIIKNIFIFLWSLLFVIPGIIKALAYAMVPYIYVYNYNGNEMDLLKKSEEMMKGHKFELFGLWFSFIGWWLLVPLTCGLALFYVVPMWQVALAEFYNEIKYEGGF